MRIATVLAVVSAYGAFVEALNQVRHGHSRLHNLSPPDSENLSAVAPLSFLSAYAYNPDPYATCSWGTNLVCEMDSPQNDLKLGSTCDVGVPVPKDNYVGDERVNEYDNGLTATAYPYIEITSTGPNPGLTPSTEASTGQLAWDGYMENPAKSQNNIKFPSVGVYDVAISANDYDRLATCEGCVAIRDTYRPRFKDGTCPSAPSSSLTLTSTSVADVSKYESDYENFVSTSNQLNNPESDASCNIESSKLQNFYDVEPAPFSGMCFSSGEVKNNLDRLKVNPFNTVDIKRPVLELEKDLNGNCVWCCSKSIALKEKYTEYTCPSTAVQPATECVGLPSSTCSMDACIKATGHDIAEATVKLSDAVQEDSKKVIQELGKPDNTDVANMIHYSLPCTSYDQTGNDPQCHYIVKLSDVLDIGPQLGVGPKFVTDLALNSEMPSDYVFWRVKVGSKDWATWDPKNDAEYSFKASSTTVNVEAWTACGQISSIEIVVKLYLH
ncbi:hypothetical protein L917_20794, partial [Phytophthora nicotianae]